MSFTSRTMVLLGLLVASLFVTANAGRDLAGTSKLGVDITGPVTVTLLAPDVMEIFAGGGQTVTISFSVDTVGDSSPAAMAVDNGMGRMVQMDIATGVVNKLAPVAVAVKKDRLVKITWTRNGETKTFTVDLAKVTTAITKRVVTPAVTTSEVSTAVSVNVQLDLIIVLDVTI